jgi:hypothetical protein
MNGSIFFFFFHRGNLILMIFIVFSICIGKNELLMSVGDEAQQESIYRVLNYYPLSPSFHHMEA